MKTYDLRSDTFTMPTPAMRQAIAEAPVGDDVFGEDPTVNRLEEKACEITGKEAALFVSSGTMGNLISFFIWAGPGKEIILHEKAHALHYELTGMSSLAGAIPMGLPGERGILTPETAAPAIRHGQPYYMAATGLIEIENSHNFAGGTCYSAAQIEALGQLARREGLPLHMDGARIFNAAAAVKESAGTLCAPVDSITFCLSKGLGAPMGSLLCGPADFIKEARIHRKRLGGGMRQIGFMAAAGLYALENNIPQCADDNRNARRLAKTLEQECPWAEIKADSVETNILFFDTPTRTAASVSEALKAAGVLTIPTAPHTVRMVTSLQVTDEDVSVIQEILRGLDVRKTE